MNDMFLTIINLVNIDFLRKFFIIKEFKKRTKKDHVINLINRLIISNFSFQDYIGELSDVDNNFLSLYESINEKDILNIIKVMEYAYYTELIKNHNYEIRLTAEKTLTLFKKNKIIKTIKHSSELQQKYINQVKNL